MFTFTFRFLIDLMFYFHQQLKKQNFEFQNEAFLYTSDPEN